MQQTRALTRLGTFAAAVSFAAFFGVGTAGAVPEPSGPTRVPINAMLLNCDFSRVANAVQLPRPFSGRGTALVHRSGSTVVAEISMVVYSGGNLHYDVVMIPAPRPSSVPCGPGSPGTFTTGMDTDAAGQAAVTLQGTLPSGSTGVWFTVQRPNPHNQAPAEFYSSEFVAPI